MAQCQDERRIAEDSLDPVKITDVTEREESQQQQQQQPSAPSFQTKPTNVADDLNVQHRDEHEIHHAEKKSMLQLAKEKAKTLIGWPGNDRREEDDDQFEEEEGHDHFSPEEKENTKGVKKEETADLNSDGSAVSPGLDAFPTGNLINDPDVDKEQEEIKTGIRSTFPNANVVTADYERGTAGDRAPLPAETVQGQQEVPPAPDRWFDAEDMVARAPAVKDQNPSLSHIGSDEFGLTEPISEKVEYAYDKLGVTEIDRLSEEFQGHTVGSEEAISDDVVAGVPIGKDQNPSCVTHIGSEEFGLTEPISVDVEYAEDKVGDTEINRDSDEFQDLKVEDSEGRTVTSEEANENAGRCADLGAYTSVEGSKDTPAMDLGGTDLYANEKDKVKKDEEGPGHDDTGSTGKNEISSQLGYGEYQEPEQEAAEKRTEKPSADDEGLHEESGEF